ncbi:hypothetical protein [Serratia proteamaculans]|uniref:Uncharacterized protein n=1 Tax=Serratia proteamaculans TaxID=28151 RepID=A0A5Q2VF55_SERPR|nr:hypothetical protein [Serratia proteamaculans]QGH62013.1 hypothetical protein GHV41_14780 [Serratia proteamaculans]
MIESESVRRKPSSIAVLPHKNSEITEFTSLQYYLRAPADKKPGYKLGGVNYDYARNIYGGKGEHITLVSMEGGPWSHHHLDLPDYVFAHGDPLPEIDFHDTMSLGIMAGKDNGFGVTGIANQAKFGYLRGASWLYEIADCLKPGDVVQVGMQSSNGDIAGCRMVTLNAKDARGNIVASDKLYLPEDQAKIWVVNAITLPLPAGTTQQEVVIDAIREQGNNSDVHFDDFNLSV